MDSMPFPRISSRTPLPGTTLLPTHRKSATISSSSPMSSSGSTLITHFKPTIQPRKTRHRNAFFAVAMLSGLCVLLIFVQQYSLSPSLARRTDSSAADQMALALETLRNSRLNAAAADPGHHYKTYTQSHRPQIKLNPAQELAAVSSFIASLSANIIPSSVDPSRPIDPQLVLEFDTRGARAAEEVDAMVEDVWLRNPVFLYSKRYSSESREMKSILESLNLHPAPTIIDVDIRDDADVLTPLITRLTSTSHLPVLLVAGNPLESVDELRDLQESGELKKLVTAAGAIVDGAKKKKHRK